VAVTLAFATVFCGVAVALTGTAPLGFGVAVAFAAGLAGGRGVTRGVTRGVGVAVALARATAGALTGVRAAACVAGRTGVVAVARRAGVVAAWTRSADTCVVVGTAVAVTRSMRATGATRCRAAES
jgi:hypothetical protein